VERDVIEIIEVSSDLSSKKLSELGLPPLHIHQIARGSAERFHLEISGDVEVVALPEAAWA